jgi:flavin-dependent dehydrogenase
MSERYDVAIAGARCAGAALAAFLARSGARVALFDRQPMPSDCVLSTHTIHPPGMEVLDALGVGARVREATPSGNVVRLENDGAFVDLTFADGRSEYCPKRRLLDGWLQETATLAGARLYDRTRVIDVARKNGRVAGLRVRHGTEEREIACDLVVGADGRRSTIAERVGAEEYLGYDAPRAAYWAYWPVPSVWRDRERYPFDFYVGHRGTAFRAIFPTNDDQLLLATAPPLEQLQHWKGQVAASYRADLASDPVLAPLVKDNEPAGELRGTLKERYFFREATGPGWVLVGDAGHHKDYLIGDGITEALRQARSLARAMAAGSDEALIRWWRERDVECLPIFRFAEDQGVPKAQPALSGRIFDLLRRSGRGSRLSDIFDRRVGPYDAVPLAVALRALAAGVFAGHLELVPEFLSQGRRARAVKAELVERQELLAAVRP